MPVDRFSHTTTRIPSFGECIYCGAKAQDVELTDEHVIPFSLGGKLVITEGSCKSCARETTRIENELARKVYWDFRLHTNLPTRRKKERPSERPFLLSINDGPAQEVYAPIKDHPFFVYLPTWGTAGILEGAKPQSNFPEAYAHVFSQVPPNIRETVRVPEGTPFKILSPAMNIDAGKFARAIAKIAYCQAVVTFGLRGFRPLMIPDFILGKYPYAPYLVGSMNETPPNRGAPDVRHAIAIGEIAIQRLRLLVATLRIFSNSGSGEIGVPLYHAVVGAPLAGRRLVGRRECPLLLPANV